MLKIQIAMIMIKKYITPDKNYRIHMLRKCSFFNR